MDRLAPLMSSAKDDWQTPDCVLDRVRMIAPIGLDPCTAEDNPVGARWFYTPEDDGLSKSWWTKVENHELIYVNPPYGRGIGAWVDKCREAAKVYDRVVALLPARTDTKWFPWDADAICFWRGRLKFRGAPAPAPFPSAVVWWHRGYSRQPFIDAFGDAGKVVLL